MNKLMISILSIVFLFTGVNFSYASDWDKAGKVLTVVEGLRIFSGGKVDLVGNLIGINRNSDYAYNRKSHRRKHRKRQKKHHYSCIEKTWVPEYVWKKKHVPEHETYDDHLGRVVVEEHYVRYKVEHGGYWEESYNCGH